MTKYIYFFTICILFFVLLVIFLNRRINELEKSNLAMSSEINITQKIFRTVLNGFNNFILYDNSRILNVELINKDGIKMKLSNIIDDEKLIIYLPMIDCHSCSAKEIEVLKKNILPNERKRICILAKFRNKRELKIFERNAGLQTFEIKSDDNLFSRKILNEIPVTFLISNYLNGYCFLLNDKENYKISEEYYEMIQRRFKK